MAGTGIKPAEIFPPDLKKNSALKLSLPGILIIIPVIMANLPVGGECLSLNAYRDVVLNSFFCNFCQTNFPIRAR
ncbi:MAG: hypothetical protein WC586_04240 [Methanoregula sp.]